MSINTLKYIQEYIRIRTKDSKVVKFQLNEPQMKLYNLISKQHQEGKPKRVIILKARQMGFSTLTEAIIFKNTATKKNVSSGIITHIEEATTNLFNMSKLMYYELPILLQPKLSASNAKELVFNDKDGKGLNSKIKCMTAGSSGVGRSSTFNNLHISEYAFWQGDKKETLNGLLQAVPNTPESMVIIESTANGYEHFRELWYMAVSGQSDFEPLFVGWNEMKEYSMKYNGFELSQEEKELKDKYTLTNEQLSWRRWCIANNCSGDINLFKQEYPINPEEAFISTGETVFDVEIVQERLQEVGQPIKQGEFEYDRVGNTISNIRWVDKSNGVIRLYSLPEPKWQYAIGGDTAGEGSDYFIGQVISKEGKQVAVLRSQYDEDKYSEQMFCLGKYYNYALLGIESNFSTYPIKELEKLGYEHMFYRTKEDTITHKMILSYGFKTTSLTRPIIISELVKIMRENIDLIYDRDTLNEAMTFIRNEKGRPEAQQGYHDDLIMGLAIAYYIRQQIDDSSLELTNKQQWEQEQYQKRLDTIGVSAAPKGYMSFN